MSHVTHDRKIERVLRRIREDGILLAEDQILRTVEHPNWDRSLSAHDWRRHVPPSMRADWGALPLLTRLCVFDTAELIAMEEDADAVMVTGPRG